MNPMKLMDEPCPKCGLMKWYHLPVADYYRCIFCSFHKKGEFFIREAYEGDDYCLECEDFIQGSNLCEHDD